MTWRADLPTRRAESPLAWTFADALRRSLLARLGERMLTSRWEITPLGRQALAAQETES